MNKLIRLVCGRRQSASERGSGSRTFYGLFLFKQKTQQIHAHTFGRRREWNMEYRVHTRFVLVHVVHNSRVLLQLPADHLCSLQRKSQSPHRWRMNGWMSVYICRGDNNEVSKCCTVVALPLGPQKQTDSHCTMGDI